jgi:galactose mutarotase-like enzyme
MGHEPQAGIPAEKTQPGFESRANVCFAPGVPAYETCEKAGATLDILEENGLRFAVNRTGAELISLARRDVSGTWRGFLYRDGEAAPPAEGWGNHATVMGYFLHRLWKEQSTYRGHVIKGGNHGFLRHFAFDAPEVRGSSLVYRVPSSRIPAEAYPLRVSLELTYRLENDGLRVEFAFTNEEPELDAHLSFGLHPGFAVTSLQTCKLLLPPGRYVRHFAPGNFLNGKTETLDFPGGDMPFSREKLLDSYLLALEGVPHKVFTLEDFESGRRVVLDFSEVPFLTLWSDMSPFFCVEPCWGLPDSNPPVPFEQKVGIQVVPAGQTLTRGFAISPGFLP